MYCIYAPIDVHYYLMFRYGSLIHVLKLLSFPMRGFTSFDGSGRQGYVNYSQRRWDGGILPSRSLSPLSPLSQQYIIWIGGVSCLLGSYLLR